MGELDQRDYERLLAFRTGLRRFLSWSGQQAEAAGITPAQHQLLLAVRGHPDPRGPTIGEIAGYLLVRHHSAVELIDRAVAAGLVDRQADDGDGRTVRIALTARGRERLEKLAASHLEELARALRELPGWQRHDDSIWKTYQFDDFASAALFVGRVADTTAATGHQPDIAIRGGRVTLELAPPAGAG